jgi:hypothetical protein
LDLTILLKLRKAKAEVREGVPADYTISVFWVGDGLENTRHISSLPGGSLDNSRSNEGHQYN